MGRVVIYRTRNCAGFGEDCRYAQGYDMPEPEKLVFRLLMNRVEARSLENRTRHGLSDLAEAVHYMAAKLGHSVEYSTPFLYERENGVGDWIIEKR